MRVVIAGGHGKIALLLERLLAGRGDQAVGLIRNPAHVAEVQQAGAEAVVCDLEAASAADVAALLSGADAVVFAAGAGPGSGVPRKDSVDRGASVLLADAAERAGVRRFVQVSSMGADQPAGRDGDEVWAAYITAKTTCAPGTWTGPSCVPAGSPTPPRPTGSGSRSRRFPGAASPAQTWPGSSWRCWTLRVAGT
jgi:nucleoside-diphosphate-sugar epimerase